MASKHDARDYGEMTTSDIIDTVITDALMQGTFTPYQDRNNGATIACMVRGMVEGQ